MGECKRDRKNLRDGRRKRASTDELAPLEEERELARGQLQRAVVAPKLRELTSFEPLAEDAQPGAIPVEHLAAAPRAVDEEEEIAALWVTTERASNESVEAVVAFAKIRRLRCGPHAHVAGAADHPSARSNAARS